MHVLIAGVSTRAAAESAAKAGFEVTALDAFGDLDQHPSVRSRAVPRDTGQGFTASAAALAAREIACDTVVYLSPFENHPRAVDVLAVGPSTSLRASRVLWGNPPDVLRRVRDPFLVAGSLRRHGFATPITRVDVPNSPEPGLPEPPGEWLVKPFRSGGGHGVRRWLPGTSVPRHHFAQERIDGVPASMAFVAAGGRAVPLGVSHQFVGDQAFGASGYRYCGNVLASGSDTILTDDVERAAGEIAQHVARTFDLVGVNGIDFIVRDGVPHVIEVNPRWSAPMELIEQTYGLSMFGMHAAACADGLLPEFDLSVARRGAHAAGKAVVFAREDVIVHDTTPWLQDSTVRDVPRRGEKIAAGEPVCTVFAEHADVAGCHAALVRRAEAVYLELLNSGIRDQGSGVGDQNRSS